MENGICVSIEYPTGSIIKKVIRKVWADSEICKVSVKDEIEIAMDGGEIDATRIPLPLNSENLLMLCNVTNPAIRFTNMEEGYTVRMTWNAEELKNCMLWYSNRGRKFVPWNGTNLCLGIEPITAAFDLGDIISRGENPLKKNGVRTGRKVKAGEVVTLINHMELEAFAE